MKKIINCLALTLTLSHAIIQPRSFKTCCRSLQRLYKATPCSDQQLTTIFSAMQTTLNLKNKTKLFEAQKISIDRQKAVAIYDTANKAIVINKSIWPQLSPLEQKHCLYHELRHEMQFNGDNESVWKNLYNLTILKNLTIEQAYEYDADHFGAQKAAKNCPDCLKELKKRCEKTKPQRYQGYFIQKDFNPLIKKSLENSRFCKEHKK